MSIEQPRQRLFGRTSLFSVLILALFAGALFAHGTGSRFPHQAGDLLELGFTQAGSYRTQVLAGFNAWNNTPTVVLFSETSIVESEVDVSTVSSDEDVWGWFVRHPCKYGTTCRFDYVELFLNTRLLASESTFIRQKAATHEIGHALGFEHPSTSFTGKSIMKQGALSYNVPQTHDVSDTNALYVP